jgi:hypothetical protein
MSKTFPKKIDKSFDVSFYSNSFVLSRFPVFLSDGRPKIQNCFFLAFFVSRFWAFLGEGRSKTRPKEIGEKNLIFFGGVI